MRIGPLTKLLVSLALPIFIDTLLVMTLGAADTFMLSRYYPVTIGIINAWSKNTACLGNLLRHAGF